MLLLNVTSRRAVICNYSNGAHGYVLFVNDFYHFNIGGKHTDKGSHYVGHCENLKNQLLKNKVIEKDVYKPCEKNSNYNTKVGIPCCFFEVFEGVAYCEEPVNVDNSGICEG